MSKKTKQPLTEAEKLEFDLQLENELQRLQRQYRILDRDRGAYTSGGKLAKQRHVLQILRKEHGNILTDLFVATCSTRKKQDAEVTGTLNNLLGEHEDFAKDINEKQAHLREIDEQIVMVKKEVITQRSLQVTDAAYMAKVLRGQKTVEQLENKLDAAIKRFCTILTDNRKKRDEIHHLLLERISFNKIWQTLIGNLNKGKAFMMDLIEQATIAYDQREEWVTKLQALRSRGHSDLIIHTQEMQELQRKLDHDGKLKDFLTVKGQKRIMKSLEEREMRKREVKREKLRNDLEKYKELLATILEFTDVEDIDSLTQKYVRIEEENFAVFNYINVIYTELEGYAEELVPLRENIDFQRNLNETRAAQQDTTLEKLNADLALATEDGDQVQGLLDETENNLQQIYSGITKLFSLCKCSNAPFLELLGDNTKINDYNVLLYLEMLEKRTSELLLNAYYKQKTSTKKLKAEPHIINEYDVARQVFDITAIAPTNPCPLCVDQENVQDVIDTLQFVQPIEEVQIKLEQRLLLPDGLERLHNVSACHLPKSRQIIQRRYQ